MPAAKTVRKWIIAAFSDDDIGDDNRYTAALGGIENIDLGESYVSTKDPEHLPAATALERLGDGLRIVPRFFRSDASTFGVRVTLATMSIGIICYLEASQVWFIENRLLWALYAWTFSVC